MSTVRKIFLSMSVMLAGFSPLFAADPAPAASPLGGLFPLIIIFVIFYFFLIRPQQKRSREHQKMLAAVKKDDQILSSGGIYGTVAAVKGDVVEVKIAENVRVQMAKSAVSQVIPQNQPVTPEIVK